MVRKFVTIFAISSTLVLAGCNTLRGLGDDVDSTTECVTGQTC